MSVLQSPITAIIPVKNGEKWLVDFESNIYGSLRHIDQIVLIDDNSDDSTWDKMKCLEKRMQNLEIYRNPQKGLSYALNTGIDIAQNEWIARYDIDDKYESNRIQLQIEAISEFTVGIFSDYRIMANDNLNLGTIYSPIFPTQTALSLIHSERTAHPSALLRKSALVEVGKYKQEDFPVEDLALWLRLLKVGELVSIPQVLLTYNLHISSTSWSKRTIALQKTKEFTSQNVELKKYLDKAKINFQECLEQYDDIADGEKRVLSFLRDFMSANSIYSESTNEFEFLWKAVTNRKSDLFNLGRAGIELLYYKIKRNNFRRAFTSN